MLIFIFLGGMVLGCAVTVLIIGLAMIASEGEKEKEILQAYLAGLYDGPKVSQRRERLQIVKVSHFPVEALQ